MYFVCVYACATCACMVPAEVRSGNRSPGAGVRDGCEPPYGCLESNLGPLQEPSLQPLIYSENGSYYSQRPITNYLWSIE